MKGALIITHTACATNTRPDTISYPRLFHSSRSPENKYLSLRSCHQINSEASSDGLIEIAAATFARFGHLRAVGRGERLKKGEEGGRKKEREEKIEGEKREGRRKRK